MTLTQKDPVRATPSPDHDGRIESHAYVWYDPDAAAFDQSDEWLDLDPVVDEDEPVMVADRA
jgi:hypothetical protein